MKYKKWMPPLIVIAALLLALVLRWHMEAYKNYDDGIVKYYRDTWTGNVWLKVYTINRYIFTPVGESAYKFKVKRRHEMATLVWMGLMVINLAWLFFTLRKEKVPDVNFVLVEPKPWRLIFEMLPTLLVIGAIMYWLAISL